MQRITGVQVQLFHIPLAEVLVDAKHGDHHFFELITATVTLDDGSQGTGYTYTGGKGGHAIAAMIEHDLAPFLIGRDATPIEEIYDAMQNAIATGQPYQTRLDPPPGDRRCCHPEKSPEQA